MTTAIYPGTFDPMTLGHEDLTRRAALLFDHVIVAVADSRAKSPFFTPDERVELASEVLRPLKNVSVVRFSGLLTDFVRSQNARVIVRGLRAATDFEYELQIAHANADMEPQIDTVFLPTRANYGFVSASLVREIASHGGNVSHYAPEIVCAALRNKFPRP